MTDTICSHKIKPEHLARKAIVYLRQSSERQVLYNKESRNTPVCDDRTGARSGLETG